MIYQQRNDILDAPDLGALIAALREGCFTDLVRQFVPQESVEEQWDLPALEKVLAEEWQMPLDLQAQVQASNSMTDEDIVETVVAEAHARFAQKVALVGEANFLPFQRMVLLQSIDSHWREHLSALDYLRQGIHLRGYAQKQPKQEYKREAFELFGLLLDAVKNEVTRILMTVRIESGDQAERAAQDIEQRAEQISHMTYSAPDETGQPQVSAAESQGAQQAWGHAGRNDPCPCGSGKKYKQCHGKLA